MLFTKWLSGSIERLRKLPLGWALRTTSENLVTQEPLPHFWPESLLMNSEAGAPPAGSATCSAINKKPERPGRHVLNQGSVCTDTGLRPMTPTYGQEATGKKKKNQTCPEWCPQKEKQQQKWAPLHCHLPHCRQVHLTQIISRAPAVRLFVPCSI